MGNYRSKWGLCELTTRAESRRISFPFVVLQQRFSLTLERFFLHVFARSWNNNNHPIVWLGVEGKAGNEKQIWRGKWHFTKNTQSKSTPIFLSNPSCCSKGISTAAEKINRITAQNQVGFILRNTIQEPNIRRRISFSGFRRLAARLPMKWRNNSAC